VDDRVAGTGVADDPRGGDADGLEADLVDGAAGRGPLPAQADARCVAVDEDHGDAAAVGVAGDHQQGVATPRLLDEALDAVEDEAVAVAARGGSHGGAAARPALP